MTYREHRIPTSLERHVGTSTMTQAERRATAARAWHENIAIVFLPVDFDAMPTMVRAVIEGEAKRLYGARR